MTVYCSIIRSILEYARPVWHPGLTKKMSKDIERVPKRCLKMIKSIKTPSMQLEAILSKEKFFLKCITISLVLDELTTIRYLSTMTKGEWLQAAMSHHSDY